MGTSCAIAVENHDGRFQSIRCNWDGYPTGVGAVLVLHYRDPAKIAELIKLGDISSLREEIGRKHPFDSREDKYKTWTLAYRRDRGETGTDLQTHEDFASMVDAIANDGSEWIYVNRSGDWYCAKEGIRKLRGLTRMTVSALREKADRMDTDGEDEYYVGEYNDLARKIENSVIAAKS